MPGALIAAHYSRPRWPSRPPLSIIASCGRPVGRRAHRCAVFGDVFTFSVFPHADMSRVCWGAMFNTSLCLERLWTGTCRHIRKSFCPRCRIFVLSLRRPIYNDNSLTVVLHLNAVCRGSSSWREQCWLPSFCRALKPFMQKITSRDAVFILNDS